MLEHVPREELPASFVTDIERCTRRRETGIMRLVGASNFFIQLPFILESMIAAAIGAAGEGRDDDAAA